MNSAWGRNEAATAATQLIQQGWQRSTPPSERLTLGSLPVVKLLARLGHGIDTDVPVEGDGSISTPTPHYALPEHVRPAQQFNLKSLQALH